MTGLKGQLVEGFHQLGDGGYALYLNLAGKAQTR